MKNLPTDGYECVQACSDEFNESSGFPLEKMCYCWLCHEMVAQPKFLKLSGCNARINLKRGPLELFEEYFGQYGINFYCRLFSLHDMHGHDPLNCFFINHQSHHNAFSIQTQYIWERFCFLTKRPSIFLSIQEVRLKKYSLLTQTFYIKMVFWKMLIGKSRSELGYRITQNCIGILLCTNAFWHWWWQLVSSQVMQ